MNIKKILFNMKNIDVEKALPDAVVFCGKDGKIQWVSDKVIEVFETSKIHLLTSLISDFIENPIELAKQSYLSGAPVIVKLINKECYFDMTAKEINEGYVLSFRDTKKDIITPSQVQNQKDYNVVNRDKNNFLLKLSNDFKSPLQSIVGFSQAMTDGLGGEMTEQQEKYIKIIKKNSTDLMYFITKLIELSATEIDTNEQELKIFDVVNLVNCIVKFNEQLYKGKDVRWKVCLDNNLKNTIISDENLIKNILQNIIDVILKSVDIGEIAISLTKPDEDLLQNRKIPNGDYVHIILSSSSMLLTENELESMFDPYMIIDTPNRKNLLRSITLACVKNLVILLKGYVWIESTILKNTSFNIIIPVNKD